MLMFPYPKTWNLIGKPPWKSLTFAQEYSTKAKISICVIAQQWSNNSFI